MKLVSHFSDFLRDVVNLNQGRIDTLDGNVTAIKNFVRQCEWKPTIKGFEEQGSWAHRTIIKPVDFGEFDADLLVMVDAVDGWSAADYVTKLGDAFSGSGTYADKTKTWDYCVTVNYAGDQKVDIAPCIVNRLYEGSYEVCNRKTNEFELSEPILYTRWLITKNSYSGSNSFRKVTRLIKYLRDIKGRFTCPSVVLTTLIGQQISILDKDSVHFADTPTTLRTLVGRLDDYLQLNPSKPKVPNPYLPNEDFAKHWTDEQYSNFRNCIHRYRGWVDEAYTNDDRDGSILAWRRLFGDSFAKDVDVQSRTTKTLAESLSLDSILLSTAAHLDTLVDMVKSFGVSILPASFKRPPHMRTPHWPRSPSPEFELAVFAVYQPGRYSHESRPLRSGDALPRTGGVWFDVRQRDGVPIPSGYAVEWRITNTGAAAIALGKGRGNFYAPNVERRRWEELEYRGVHLAEAFVIRRSDDVLVAQSDPFYVVIE